MKTHKPTVFILMSLLSIFGCGRAKTPEYPADRLSARDGTEFTITFSSTPRSRSPWAANTSTSIP